MATYLSRSNVQEDSVQTLHLMNSGFSGYTDAANAGTLVLVNHPAGSGQSNPAGYSGQQQHQHFIGFPTPPAITQSSLPQQSTLTNIYSSSVGQQNLSSNLFTNSSTFNWTVANELPLIQSNDVAHINPSLTARLTSMNSGQQSNPNISQFNMRRQVLHDEQASMLHNGIALGLNMDSSQASDGINRGLSLSLSSQQPPVQMHYYNLQPDESGISSCPGLGHVVVENTNSHGERLSNKWIGSLGHFRACSRDGLVGSGFQNSTNDVDSRHMCIESKVSTVVGPAGLLASSKYLKPAQQLLDEVVSVAQIVKSSSSKQLKLQSWMSPNSFMDGSFARNGNLSEAGTTAKDGTAGATSMPSFASGAEQKSSPVIEIAREERQELQTKKAKLTAMLDEVDRRYKQYYNQMEIVVTSFESAAGLGAAKTYTALALQTISRHFRCLRDAIVCQIRVASRALGEEDLSTPFLGRGETPRLRYLDQQLRQQRALQQIGMMQQHAWRPQRGLPERSVSILRAWLFEHFLHPYPKDADKLTLARQTGLTRNQVSNWFINARVRLWKPMVEEMYIEETKESDRDRTPSADQRSNGDKYRGGRGDEGSAGNADDRNHGFNKQVRAEAGGSDCGAAAATQVISAHQHSASDMSQQTAARNDARLKIAANSTADADLLRDDRTVKKARSDSCQQRDSLAVATMLAGADMQDFNSDSNKSEESFEHESKDSYTMRGIHHAFADYLVGGGAGRYTQEEFADPRYANAGGSNNVSLTLGLQHCDGLSVDGAHHQPRFYPHQESHDDAAVVAAAAAHDYYSINNSNFEALAELQSRKRFASPLLHHDFIA